MRHKPRTLTPSQEGRLFVGLLLQPFVAGGVAFVLFRLVLLDRAGRTLAGSTPDDPGGAAFAVAISTGIVAFMATLLLALPAVVWLLLRQGSRARSAGLAGVPWCCSSEGWATTQSCSTASGWRISWLTRRLK